MTAERARQKRSLASFARAIGLSRATLDSIEHHRKTSYDPATLATLEYALGWKAGSVARVLAGLNPEYDTDQDLTAITDAWPKLSPGTRRTLAILAVEAARAEG